MNVHKVVKLTGAVALAVLALAGCRAEEQGRLLEYKPGVYLGKPDTQLSEAQLRTLRHRSLLQGSTVSDGGGSSSTSRNVRKPSDPPVNEKELRDRVRMQAGSTTQ